jgi:DNA-binding transcriptional ArsR family regulator
MTVARALADENRVRVLLVLRARELCVCQIIEFLSLAPSTVSKHLSILKHARLVDTRKDGRWIYYRLAGKGAPEEARSAIRWIERSLAADPDGRADIKRINAIERTDREKICAKYKRSSARSPRHRVRRK